MSLEYVEIYIDSRDGITTTNSSLVTDWPTIRFETPLSNIEKMKVLEAEIPFSYYVVNASNNTFSLEEPTIGTTQVTLPVGNYTSTNMSSTLSSALTLASTTLGNRIVGSHQKQGGK